jgi:N-acetylglucosamine malate deacetylase 1
VPQEILVVAVHPDDETLGCGGALLRHVADGDHIHWLVVTDMVPEMFPRERIAAREKEIDAVAAAYAFTSVHRLKLPTTRLDTIADSAVVDAFARVFHEVRPTTVYLPFLNDVHSDHRKAFHAGLSCVKSFRHPHVKRVLMMEVLSETEFAPSLPGMSFVPNVFCDISRYIDRKIEILGLYGAEMGIAPFPRSAETVMALAAYRGAVAGCMHAEAFMLLKDVY